MGYLKGVWVFNKTVSTCDSDLPFLIPFTSNGQQYSHMVFEGLSLIYVTTAGDRTYPYFNGKWADEAYRTIDFADFDNDMDGIQYEWFIANASMKPFEPERIYRVKKSTLTAICEKLRALTNKETKYTSLKISDGIDEVYEAAKSAYNRAEEVAF